MSWFSKASTPRSRRSGTICFSLPATAFCRSMPSGRTAGASKDWKSGFERRATTMVRTGPAWKGMPMSNAGFDMSTASLVEVLGPADPNQTAEPYTASPALQLRHFNELLGALRGFLAKAGLPDRIGVNDLVEYFE